MISGNKFGVEKYVQNRCEKFHGPFTYAWFMGKIYCVLDVTFAIEDEEREVRVQCCGNVFNRGN